MVMLALHAMSHINLICMGSKPVELSALTHHVPRTVQAWTEVSDENEIIWKFFNDNVCIFVDKCDVHALSDAPYQSHMHG